MRATATSRAPEIVRGPCDAPTGTPREGLLGKMRRLGGHPPRAPLTPAQIEARYNPKTSKGLLLNFLVDSKQTDSEAASRAKLVKYKRALRNLRRPKCNKTPRRTARPRTTSPRRARSSRRSAGTKFTSAGGDDPDGADDEPAPHAIASNGGGAP